MVIMQEKAWSINYQLSPISSNSVRHCGPLDNHTLEAIQLEFERKQPREML